VVAIDSLFYGRLTITPWNIVKYNVFPDTARGPNLYGTEPWSFYLLNLTLNFNVILPLALVALPALAVTYAFDRKRLGAPGAPDQGGAYETLALRLAPVYVWVGLLSAQAHKEERFMYPVYPLLCFNAAVTLYLMRGWMEKVYVVTTTQYQVISPVPMILPLLTVVLYRLPGRGSSATLRSRCLSILVWSPSRASSLSTTTTTRPSLYSSSSRPLSSRKC
jgi:alpha-1,2-mannosyltransferase